MLNAKSFFKYNYNTLNPNIKTILETIEGEKISSNYLESGEQYWTSGTDQYCPGRYRSVSSSYKFLIKLLNLFYQVVLSRCQRLHKKGVEMDGW